MTDTIYLKKQYARDGYILLDGILPDSLFQEVQSHTRAIVEAVSNGTLIDPLLDIVEDNKSGKHLRRIEHPEKFHTIYDQVMRHESLLDVVQELLGGTVRFDHGKLNFKPPAAGAEVQWHQDWLFFRTPMTTCSLLV